MGPQRAYERSTDHQYDMAVSLGRLLSLISRIHASLNVLGLRNTLVVFSYLLGRRKGTHVRLAIGDFLFSPVDDKGVVSQFYLPGYRLVGEITGIVDAGANIGVATARFRAHNPEAYVIAGEAAKRNETILRHNFGDDPQVLILHAAIWWRSESLSVISGPTFESFHTEARIEEHMDTVDGIEMSTVLGFLPHGHSADLVKFDIEGAESVVFEGGDLSWLQDVKALVFEVPDRDNPGALQRIMDAIWRSGWRGSSYVCGENLVMCKHDSGISLVEETGIGS